MRDPGFVTVSASSCRDNGNGICTSCSTVHTMPALGFDVSDLDDADADPLRLTVAGPPPSPAGELTIELGDREVAVPVAEGDSDGSVAARATAAINEEPGPW